MNREDEFYVGYLKPMPRDVARRVRMAVLWLGSAVIGVGVMAAGLQSDAGHGRWETGPAEVLGRFVASPFPMVKVEGEGGVRTVLLVGEGKCGAFSPEGYCGLLGGDENDPAAARRAAMELFEGRIVRARGTRISRDGREMLELASGPTAVAVIHEGREAEHREAPPMERVRLRGRIVDAKCYLGAMKPGDGKTHRGCAVRCIEGGIPPVLVVPAAGGPRYYLLSMGERTASVVPFVGDDVEVEGDAEAEGDLRVLRVEPGSLLRCTIER